jgi:hypothetical protein
MKELHQKAFTTAPYCKLNPDFKSFMPVVEGNVYGVFNTLLWPKKANKTSGNTEAAMAMATAATAFVLGQYAHPGKGNGMIFQSLAEFRRALANQTASTGPHKNGLENHVRDLEMTDDGLICFHGDPKKTIGKYTLVKKF